MCPRHILVEMFAPECRTCVHFHQLGLDWLQDEGTAEACDRKIDVCAHASPCPYFSDEILETVNALPVLAPLEKGVTPKDEKYFCPVGRQKIYIAAATSGPITRKCAKFANPECEKACTISRISGVKVKRTSECPFT